MSHVTAASTTRASLQPRAVVPSDARANRKAVATPTAAVEAPHGHEAAPWRAAALPLTARAVGGPARA
eukprot:2975747-Prymnesium_polylepis.1